MPFLVPDTVAAEAVGISCRAGTMEGNAQLDYVLAGVASRIAALMNVKTLSPVTTTDYFDLRPQGFTGGGSRRLVPSLNYSGPTVTKRLRLSNGLVDPSSVVITGPDGATRTAFSDPTAPFLDARMGYVDIGSPWSPGTHSVTYDSGFPLLVRDDAPEGATTVLDTSSEPWVQLALAMIVRLFYNTATGQRIQEGLRYDAVDSGIRQELAAYVYQCYERARQGVEFTRYSESVPRV